MSTKEARGYNIYVLAFIAFVVGSLGVLGAVFILINKPVQKFNAKPDADKINPGMAYYVKGSDANGAKWFDKWELISEGKTNELTLNEGELNRWAAAVLSNQRSRVSENGESLPDSWIRTGNPNFRITENGELTFATEVSVPSLSHKRFLFQSTWTFDESDPDSVSSRASLESCPIPFVNGIVFDVLCDSLIGSLERAKDLAAIKEQVKEMRLEQGELRISFDF